MLFAIGQGYVVVEFPDNLVCTGFLISKEKLPNNMVRVTLEKPCYMLKEDYNKVFLCNSAIIHETSHAIHVIKVDPNDSRKASIFSMP